KILFDPERQEHPRMAGAEAASLVAGRKVEKRSGADHRPRSILVLVDEAVLEAKLGIAIAELRRPAGRIVERQRREEMNLPVGDEAVVEFPRRPDARRAVPHMRSHELGEKLVVLILAGVRI